MTKQELINRTEYTEDELINLALTWAIHNMRELRNASQDIESWDHYENLRAAMETIYDKRTSDNEA